MRSFFIIMIVALLLFTTSCSLYQDIKGELFDTEPNDIEDLMDEYINNVEDISEKVTVSCSMTYVKAIDEDTEHRISIPKIFPATENAKKFNQKIMDRHSTAIEALNSGQDEDKVYNIGYIFEEYNGIFGILINDSSYVMNSCGNYECYGYYYDTKNDCALNYFEYLEALGVDYSEIVRAVNQDIFEYYPEEESYILSENYEDFDISSAIFSEKKAHFVLPSYGFGEILAEYEGDFIGKSNKKYDVAVLLENFYNTEIKDLNYVFFGRIIDLDEDNVPELVVNFFDGLVCSLKVYKIGNGVEPTEDVISVGNGSMVWGEYNLCMTPSGLVNLKLYEGYRDEPWEEFISILYLDYVWDGEEWQETYRGGATTKESFDEYYGFEYNVYRLSTPNDTDDYDIRSAWERQKEVRKK